MTYRVYFEAVETGNIRIEADDIADAKRILSKMTQEEFYDLGPSFDSPDITFIGIGAEGSETEPLEIKIED